MKDQNLENNVVIVCTTEDQERKERLLEAVDGILRKKHGFNIQQDVDIETEHGKIFVDDVLEHQPEIIVLALKKEEFEKVLHNFLASISKNIPIVLVSDDCMDFLNHFNPNQTPPCFVVGDDVDDKLVNMGTIIDYAYGAHILVGKK